MRRKILHLSLFAIAAVLLLNGCATWHGLKTDTKRTWHLITD